MNPPLIERAISVVIEPIEQFSIGHYGLFWSEILHEFPSSEAMELVFPEIETFDGSRPTQRSFQIMPAAALPRAAFRNAAAGELVQVQPDRFGFNWLKTGDDHAYPHSEKTLDRFFELLGRFANFISAAGLGELSVIQCEITNVNVVPVSDVGESFADMATVFRLPPIGTECPQIQIENQLIGSRHLIIGENGQPIGRVHALGQPSFKVPSNEEAYRLDIIARGAPLSPGIDGTRQFFEEAVSAVNAVFLASITKAGRQFWGEIDG